MHIPNFIACWQKIDLIYKTKISPLIAGAFRTLFRVSSAPWLYYLKNTFICKGIISIMGNNYVVKNRYFK